MIKHQIKIFNKHADINNKKILLLKLIPYNYLVLDELEKAFFLTATFVVKKEMKRENN